MKRRSDSRVSSSVMTAPAPSFVRYNGVVGRCGRLDTVPVTGCRRAEETLAFPEAKRIKATAVASCRSLSSIMRIGYKGPPAVGPVAFGGCITAQPVNAALAISTTANVFNLAITVGIREGLIVR